MTTKLSGQLRRELEIEGQTYTLTLTADGLKVAPKGKRKGYELAWKALVGGEAALAAALTASLNDDAVEQSGDDRSR
ncbi:MAG: hypothetical protein ABWZ41_09940 [Burkholderiales bacterium]|jgi:hypothetical protein